MNLFNGKKDKNQLASNFENEGNHLREPQMLIKKGRWNIDFNTRKLSPYEKFNRKGGTIRFELNQEFNTYYSVLYSLFLHARI